MKPQPGQILARPKVGPIAGWHYGVALNENAVFHNTQEGGSHIAELSSFAAGQPVWAIDAPIRTQAEYVRLVENVRQVQGRPYDAFFFNCEDAASEVKHGIPHSPTREKWLLAGLSVIGLFLVANVLGEN
ncbi:MAG: hypothetical protein AABN33_00660 [Acidobacteriota bacterium]